MNESPKTGKALKRLVFEPELRIRAREMATGIPKEYISKKMVKKESRETGN